MGLPKVIFNIATAGLALATANIQKVPGLVITGNTVADKITIGESLQVFSLTEAENNGITLADNPFAYKHVKAFYDYAGKGAELWLMLISDATTMTVALDKDEALAAKLLNDAGGRIRALGIVKESTGSVTITNGLDADVTTAVVKAQALADDFANKYYPVRIVMSGNDFNGNVQNLKDYKTSAYRNVAILLGNTDGEKEASIGLALGRIASTAVQRKLSAIEDGAVEQLNAYFTDGSKTEALSSSWDAIHDKGYIFFRNLVGVAGFFFSSDATLTSADDDFKTLANGFVMDKLMLIANSVLVKKLSAEVPMTEAGTIHPAIIKSWQSEVERNVDDLMTKKGEISNFKAFIDENQNVIATNELVVNLQVQPVGYAENIVVNIGYTTQIS